MVAELNESIPSSVQSDSVAIMILQVRQEKSSDVNTHTYAILIIAERGRESFQPETDIV